MRHRTKLLVSAFIAALALLAAVTTSQARTFQFSNTGIRAVWGAFRFEDGNFITRCPITLEGVLHSRSFSKISGELIGLITRAITEKDGCGCGGNESLWLSDEDGASEHTLPWHLRYDTFTGGALPATGIRLQVIGLAVKKVGTECEYKSDDRAPAVLELTVTGGTITAIQWVEASTIPRIRGTCGARATLAGMGTVAVLDTTDAITVTLVT